MDILGIAAVVRPSAAATLLLRACLWEGTEARDSWERWSAQLDDPTDTFRGARARLRALAPLLDAALRREGAEAGSGKMRTVLRVARAREELRATAARDVVAGALRERDRPIVLKGAVLAETAYPDPALRHTHDLDLLADPATPPSVRVTPSGMAVNVHPHLFRTPLHRDAELGIRERLVSAQVAAIQVRTLGPDDALVHVCAHAFSLGGANLGHWVPDAWFLLRARPDLDWDRLLDTAERGRLAIPLSCLLGYLREDLGAEVPLHVLDALARGAAAARPTERDAALAAVWLARGSERARAAPDHRRTLALARWALAPAPGYLRLTGRARGASGLVRAYLTRPLRALRRRGGGNCRSVNRPPRPAPAAKRRYSATLMTGPDDLIRLRAEDLEWTEIDDEVVVLDLRDSTYLSINRTGAAVWSALAQGATQEALIERLKERFDVDDATAQQGLDGFLATARERGLLAG